MRLNISLAGLNLLQKLTSSLVRKSVSFVDDVDQYLGMTP